MASAAWPPPGDGPEGFLVLRNGGIDSLTSTNVTNISPVGHPVIIPVKI